ncbi:MAG: hypothetical protein H8E41_00010 [Desulfobulbaceae bacterium]|uniref:Doubled CXXCH motif domain-containing protein n=1 Tax=Candidatus Desulfobia pelagia TaxID=2841692 RepID=A0A8J6N9Q7_9BACT|nr:hypothetical protein [Candidatus Desulfobia pelagia]
MRILFFILIIIFAGADQVWAGVFAETGHGNQMTGVLQDAAFPRGSCRQCHVDGTARYPKGLWRENDNDLCFTCHSMDTFSGLYPGRETYEVSSHIDPRFVWPGPFPPAHRELDMAGKCINCHDPHGKKDRFGVIPSMMIAREDILCLSCHDGDPSVKDISREIRKPYSHRVGSDGHTAFEGNNPDRYSYVGGNRHVACSDCHNAHAVSGDFMRPVAPEASQRNLRVSRIRVQNSGPGVIPRYEYLPASDTSTPVLEYEICYKCHSSWTQQPPGQQDIAKLLNTNNASFHPVEGQGKNFGIDPNSFVDSTMNSFSTIYCSDCHGSEDPDNRGPHGSQFSNILKGPYETQSNSRPSTREDLCFICHSFETYADSFSALFQQEASRFNKHVSHVGQQNIPCFACHASHGSPQFGALIVTGRNPGLRSFSMTTNGGSCMPTCHDSRSYTVTYPR